MPDTKDDLLSELADRLGDEPMAVLKELRATLIEPVSKLRRLDPATWGPEPDVAEVRAASAANAVRLARERAGVVADSLSREDVAELIGPRA